MLKIYVYSYLLAALSMCFVEMMTLDVSGHVGENVTFKCSGWDTWTDVTSNDKYLCKSPCRAEDIIVKAAFKKTKHKNRTELTNSADGLLVTFTNLQKSDAMKYQCRVERYGYDPYIEVNLQVADAESSSPKTTPKAATDCSALSFAVTNSPTRSSNDLHIITDLSTVTPAAALATQGAGIAPYFIIGSIFIISLVIVVVMLIRKMMKQQLMVVTTSGEDMRESAGPDGVYETLNPFMGGEDQVYCTLTPNKRNAILESMSMDRSSIS